MTMRKDVLEEILSCPSLPSLPAVAVRVIELTSDPNVKLADIGRVVEADQGLTTKILRTVNSSFYGLRQKCGSIQKALVMLGLNPVKSLALSFSLVKAVEDGHEGCTFDFTSYWRRGLYTAVAARVLGGIVRLDDPDEAFLGGLLQDVGMVAMHRALGARYDEVLRSASHHRDLVPLELSAFELQHPDVGAMLAERWKLPAQIVLPVRYHERPTAAPAICIPMIRCVAIGNIAHDVLTDADPTDAMRRLYARGEQWFDLKQEQVDEILHRISVGVREMSSVLRLSTGQVADVDEVLKKANERLVELTRADTNRVVNDESRPKMDLYEKDPTTGLGTPAAFQTAMRAAFDAGEQKGEAVSVIQVRVAQTSPTGSDSRRYRNTPRRRHTVDQALPAARRHRLSDRRPHVRDSRHRHGATPRAACRGGVQNRSRTDRGTLGEARRHGSHGEHRCRRHRAEHRFTLQPTRATRGGHNPRDPGLRICRWQLRAGLRAEGGLRDGLAGSLLSRNDPVWISGLNTSTSPLATSSSSAPSFRGRLPSSRRCRRMASPTSRHSRSSAASVPIP
ncbi:MAG: HDOD domain-containing protein [Phycisphaeraceae bacterium]|nr:HDOD domain-containing protein [Phycisphaeraceae bacterium]